MAVNKRLERAYGFGQGIYQLSPKPIVAQRAPTTADMAVIGTEWDDQVNNAVYFLVDIVGNSARWILAGQTTVAFTGANLVAAVTINSNSGVATFTGFTTAIGIQQAFTINDSYVTAASRILATIQSGPAGAGAAMVIQSIVPAAGSFVVNTVNAGGGANNGPIVITFQVLN
jgi:hypothetical protein